MHGTYSSFDANTHNILRGYIASTFYDLKLLLQISNLIIFKRGCLLWGAWHFNERYLTVPFSFFSLLLLFLGHHVHERLSQYWLDGHWPNERCSIDISSKQRHNKYVWNWGVLPFCPKTNAIHICILQ